MAAPSSSANAVTPDTLITIKVSFNDSLKKLKLPLKDLGADVLPDKVSPLTQGYTRLDRLYRCTEAHICVSNDANMMCYSSISF